MPIVVRQRSGLRSNKNCCWRRARALNWFVFASILIGCAPSSTDIPSKSGKSKSIRVAIPETVTKPASPRDLRTSTDIRFDTCLRLPDCRFENGGDHPQHSILETLGGGVAAIDYDQDGWPDLCMASGGRFLREGSAISMAGSPAALLQNQRDPDGYWVPVGDKAGIAETELFTLGIAGADFNNDGFIDLCLTGYGPVRLYQNQGDGTFVECASQRGLKDRGFTTSAGWGDLNADGVLDIYMTHYVEWNLAAERQCQQQKKQSTEICGPKNFLAESDRVFLGSGDGSFQDKTSEAGLQSGGKGLGVVIGDVDRDGDADVYVANDTTANFLYLNDGHGHLEEVGALHGVAFDDTGRPTGSMGVSLADYDNDGLPDLWTTNFEYEALALFRNMGRAQFHQVSKPAGVTAMHGDYVSWGTAFADFNGDGHLDIVVANGHLPDYVPPDRLDQPPFLLVNDGHRRFSFARSPKDSYLGSLHSGRGLAIADLNCDGQVDIVVTHLSEPARVLRNVPPVAGGSLQVALVGRDSNRDGLGTTVVLETSAGTQIRQHSGGGSYLSTSDRTLHWGLPEGVTLQKLTLHWPSGKVQVLEQQPPANAKSRLRMTIIEP